MTLGPGAPPRPWRGYFPALDLVHGDPNIAHFQREFGELNGAIMWGRYIRCGLDGFVEPGAAIGDLLEVTGRLAHLVRRCGWVADDDVCNVGRSKPIGTVEIRDSQLNLVELMPALQERGLEARCFPHGDGRDREHPWSGHPLLLVWDRAALADLLSRNTPRLGVEPPPGWRDEWREDPDDFAVRTVTELVDHRERGWLYDLIAAAYADPRLMLPNIKTLVHAPATWYDEHAFPQLAQLYAA